MNTDHPEGDRSPFLHQVPRVHHYNEKWLHQLNPSKQLSPRLLAYKRVEYSEKKHQDRNKNEKKEQWIKEETLYFYTAHTELIWQNILVM